MADTSMEAYYMAIDDPYIHDNLQDLDDPTGLRSMLTAAKNSSSMNFVLDFNADAAYATCNLPNDSIARIIAAGRPDSSHARWIILFRPFEQQAVLETLAERYDFSPRLLAMMCSDPRLPRHAAGGAHESDSSLKASWFRRSKTSSFSDYTERNVEELFEHASIASYDSIARGNLYRIIDDAWHYSSIDFGRSYICLGYNSLYGTKQAVVENCNGPLPHCTRVWTWLLICDDGTVITINEYLFPFAHGGLSDTQQRVLQGTRCNLINIFRSLSRVAEDERMFRNPLAMLPIRTHLGATPQETSHRESDTPGLLFYYIFENWYNSYTLVTRRESRYGVELATLRAEMFKSPKHCHIDRLDTIGRELGVLKRHYAGYIHIIDRLLDTKVTNRAPLQPSPTLSSTSQQSLSTIRPSPPVHEHPPQPNLPLTPASLLRFTRLKDLVSLYALNEVEQYLSQKDSLITLNFNLIAMKESTDMERLTKTTLLITKVTILFLPVSLMSAYFSIALEGTRYTVVQYWIAFAVVLVLSWAILFVFGVGSGGVETGLVVGDFWKGGRRILQRVWGKVDGRWGW
ncbi:hypothetical protein LTR62_000381 [Meristemomyces frigidus]|uniref:ADP-ribosylation factor n=1 Tax=Meristemomyces frigidus TaxID=1508187 RepID=A0AAN7TNV1_9PEZI|nr:hypothetical protein LTR62_000381 [Meristemomyces frigidus]